MTSQLLGNVPKCFLPLRSNYSGWWHVDFLLFEERLDFTRLEDFSLFEIQFWRTPHFPLSIIPLPPVLYLSLQFSAIDFQHILVQEETFGLPIVSLMTTLKGQKHLFLCLNLVNIFPSRTSGFITFFTRRSSLTGEPRFADPFVQVMWNSTRVCSGYIHGLGGE